MIQNIIYAAVLAAGCFLAFVIGRKFAGKPKTESTATTLLVRSIQAIAELAVLEYITEGVTEIKQKKMASRQARAQAGCSPLVTRS